jgi:hypothetical protein
MFAYMDAARVFPYCGKAKLKNRAPPTTHPKRSSHLDSNPSPKHPRIQPPPHPTHQKGHEHAKALSQDKRECVSVRTIPIIAVRQRCTNSGRQVALETTRCKTAPNTVLASPQYEISCMSPSGA